MRIVLDTNVLVSGLLSPFGACGDIVRMLTSGDIKLCVDARILSEYREVLKRPKFAMDIQMVETLLDFIDCISEVHDSRPLSVALPDRDDQSFLEVAISAKADYLVTGNLKHFPKKHRGGIAVRTPHEFIREMQHGS